MLSATVNIYKSEGSLGVVRRLVRMNKFCWSILLEDKQKVKCGGVDKSQIYMRFTLIYLVFCIVYYLFWAFLSVFLSCRWCSSRKIEERAKSSRKESKATMLGKAREHVATWFCHAAAWATSVKNPRLACRSMPNSCRSMPRWCKKKILRTCRRMPKSCRGMATLINLGYFWQVGFGTPM